MGTACRESNPEHFSVHDGYVIPPVLSEVSRFYDIQFFFSKSVFCGANRIRTCYAIAPDLQSGPALQRWRVPVINNLPLHLRGRTALQLYLFNFIKRVLAIFQCR
jgi:hypothetical protein